METNHKSKKGLVILVSGAKGVYVPQVFAENFRLAEWGVPEAREVLKAGPVNDKYWEAWERVLDNARFTDPDGDVYHLYHDGGLWAVCLPLMSVEEISDFFEGEY